ncbi:TerB family tellurite resistance protein [Exilibacterium tricleocarpae]|uniref:TerB family tellurite resistance protein n=1 Tax=Exilibacterium tricleocarpae TaxID=2591008 RepID=A0A545TNB1_9GAMM|nr:TerB family tellurite resistance protein [Exilibacterium tricleocarpae]TQV78709.1 TerB family tellurite resistance protein [Exilibacterium tricleocarpae]
MLDKIRDFFTTELLAEDDSGLTEHQRHIATAALLVEVATIDGDFDGREFSLLFDILQRQFELTDSELAEISKLAKQESEDATSLYQFTQLVNQHFSPEEKYSLIRDMWCIAYADGNIDKYEEYIIRKVADLIHLSHSAFIRAKRDARDGTA